MRDIYCVLCDTYLGVLRDAKVRKDAVNLCGECFEEFHGEGRPTFAGKGTGNDGGVDYLRNLFGMGK